MMNDKQKILWVDDEIDLLESHVIYLRDKGYNVICENSGEDAIERCDNEYIDLILLDEMMTGLDGLSTLRIIKDKHPEIPIILVTKNEEEWLMDEAISEKISNYLIKPVNPSQILIACKRILDDRKISSDKITKDFLKFYNEIQNLKLKKMSFDDWHKLFAELCNWFIKLDNNDNNSFTEMLFEQKSILNRQFGNFVKDNYKSWINIPENRPNISSDIFENNLRPIIDGDNQLVFIIIDCLRYDQWKKISSIFNQGEIIYEDVHLAILPTATPFARNSIFSGLLPIELKNNENELWKRMFIDKEFNKYEEELFKKLLIKNNLEDKSFSYVKISDFKNGQKLHNKINDYKSTDVLGIVVNFVDMLGHTRSESQIIKELIPNESAYRQSIFNWFQNSWLSDCINEFLNWGADVVITSDHGNTIVDKPVLVKADKTSSSGVRYKYGRNLNIKSKECLKITDPELYGLPKFDVNTEYLISGERNYFIYSNQYHKYSNMYKDSFQHGGISMDEMIVPLIHLKKK
tara:strand:- start:949 stop:2505 length:1557 start_codon:yes stop_codon:yes gene_type:complete